MPDWTGGGADKGGASVNTAEETTEATEAPGAADTTAEDTAAPESETELASPASE
ncbi:hypothetical protein AB0M29_28545 [Streptomyces sp. NPDC051976]|uniref:hypothetical protein n=1 Tax=Streptomyces sp. NPDC051976 TaxID=3154947 RepID=UPI003420D40A